MIIKRIHCIFCVFFLFTVQIVLCQPVYESFTTKTGKNSSVNINKPSGTVEGDLLVVGLMYEKGSDENISKPSGWTLIKKTNNSTDCGLQTFYKIAGNNEPSSYSFSTSNGSKWSIGCSRISNVDATDIINASSGKTGEGTNVKASSITTTLSNTLTLCFYTNKKDAHYSPHNSTTERYDKPNTSEGQPSNMLATFEHSSPGVTGDKTATASETERWAAQQISINSLPITTPIELMSFKAIPVGEKIKLKWKTACEINNEYFTIEKTNDLINWEIIKIIKGSLNSTQITNYQFEDKTPFNGNNYYRLKQTDTDGTFTYSEIICCSITLGAQLRVNPNPFSNFLTIEGNKDDLIEIRILNSLGETEIIFSRVDILINQPQKIDLSHLQPGIYFIKTNNNQIIKILKQ